MLENGYIKAFRGMLRWGWYKDIPTCKLWLHLLLCANYEPATFQGKEILPGQLVTSYASLADGSGLSVQQVRTAISKLKKTGEIEVYTNRHYTLITIPKYATYQQTDNRQITDYQQSNNTPITNHQQTDNRQITTMKESKKARKEYRAQALSREDFLERFSAKVTDTVTDWLLYKKERKESYKPTGLKSLLTEIENRIAESGEDAVCATIRLSMANGWRGIIWDRMPTAQQKQQSSNPFLDMLREAEELESQ